MTRPWPDLCYPMHPLRLRKEGEVLQVFDPIRKRWLVLTPEEWVRQHLVLHLNIDLGYPFSLMRAEAAAKRGVRPGRTDLTCHGMDGKALLLVECKAADVALTPDVLHQVAAYNNRIGARWVAVTNGLALHCAEVGPAGIGWSTSLPQYQQTV